MKLSDTQRRCLEAIHKGPNLAGCHGNTLKALLRKGLVCDRPSLYSSYSLTEEGQKALGVWQDLTKPPKTFAEGLTRFACWAEEVLDAAGCHDADFWQGYGVPKESRRLQKGACLKVTWCAGGMSGGSCYEQASHVVEPDTPKELESLDHLFLAVCPDMGFLQYKVLRNKLVESGTRSSGGDYYGNSYVTGYQKVRLEQLYCLFRDEGWLPWQRKS